MLHKERAVPGRSREPGTVEPRFSASRDRKRPNSRYVSTIKEAERLRQQVFREINNLVTRIQHPGLNEEQLREMNDEINELLREKKRWEYRIKELGGRNYLQASKLVDNQGNLISDTRDYKYFGRAKELPEAKKLLEKEALPEEEGSVVSRELHLGEFYYGSSVQMDDDPAPQVADIGPLEQASISIYPLPSNSELEKWILGQKKAALLKRYTEFK
jgi:pre-mRNA-splicing factor ISY1